MPARPASLAAHCLTLEEVRADRADPERCCALSGSPQLHRPVQRRDSCSESRRPNGFSSCLPVVPSPGTSEVASDRPGDARRVAGMDQWQCSVLQVASPIVLACPGPAAIHTGAVVLLNRRSVAMTVASTHRPLFSGFPESGPPARSGCPAAGTFVRSVQPSVCCSRGAGPPAPAGPPDGCGCDQSVDCCCLGPARSAVAVLGRLRPCRHG